MRPERASRLLPLFALTCALGLGALGCRADGSLELEPEPALSSSPVQPAILEFPNTPYAEVQVPDPSRNSNLVDGIRLKNGPEIAVAPATQFPPELDTPACRSAQSALEAAMSVETLRGLIDACRPRSLDEFVPMLPVALRYNALLAYRSGGLHKNFVTPLSPRVVLFSNTAELIVSYVGPHPGERPSLEILAFDRKQARFELAQLSWQPGQAALASRNSPTCTRCHGTDPRPIWNSYRTWPGFYGVEDDRIESGSLEDISYQKFVSDVAFEAPRYGMLDLQGKFTRYITDGERKRFLDRYTEPGKSSVAVLARYRPNTRFNNSITALLARRAARILREQPQFADKVRRIEEVPVNCKSPKITRGFVGRGGGGYYNAEDYEADRIALKVDEGFSGKTLFHGPSVEDSWKPLEDELGPAPEKLLFLFEADRKTRFFTTGLDGSWRWDCMLRNALVEPETIARSSALEERPTRPKSSETTRRSCNHCHGKDEERLGPFDDASALQSALRKYPWLEEDIMRRLRSTGADQMPPDTTLNEKEIREIEAWVSEVSVVPRKALGQP